MRKHNITAKQYHSPLANKTARLPYEKFRKRAFLIAFRFDGLCRTFVRRRIRQTVILTLSLQSDQRVENFFFDTLKGDALHLLFLYRYAGVRCFISPLSALPMLFQKWHHGQGRLPLSFRDGYRQRHRFFPL